MITVQNQLLKHENRRLGEALANEKKRRERGEPLLIQAPQEYNSGAIFWSPSKVNGALDRQAQKDADNQLLQQKKSKELNLREQQKQ